MDLDELIRRAPKVELHCHFEGSIRPETVAALAARHAMTLPASSAETLYDYERSDEFFRLFSFVAATMQDRDDYARCVYESLEDGVRTSNLRYREMFINPTLHFDHGVSAKVMLEGMAEGIRAARLDLGVDCRLIADVYRSDSPATAVEMVEALLGARVDELVGLGMDGEEAPDPPEKFVEAFRLAGRAGLRRTSHASEDAPPVNIRTCLDVLGCERVDHGYYVLDDPELLDRCLREEIGFTTSITTTVKAYFSDDLTEHPVPKMLAEGLRISLGSDDPTMVRTDLANEYLQLCHALGYGADTVRRLCLNGVDSTWLEAPDKAAMHTEFARELDGLEAELIQ